ncbi:MAG: GIY-YIG nuclease family protein [Chthoniobacterales bacterium]|nr:GIY-YIG nuclease family protein [Chthoniobacterales bacterium]
MRDHNPYVSILTNMHRTTLYIGVTNSLQRRVWQHRHGDKDGFAQRYNLTRMVYFEHFRDVNNAIAREKQLKGWLRAKKIALIERQNPRWEDLGEQLEQEPQIDNREAWISTK